MHWYALQVRSQYEQRLEAALLPRFEAYYPWRAVTVRIGNNDRSIRKAFFPGYVFARFEHPRVLPVLTIPQGWKLVSESPIPDIEIESVRQLALSKFPIMDHPNLQIGEHVRVVKGPLAGVEGKFVRLGQGSLLVVSVQMLGQSVATHLDADAIEACGAVRIAA
jgi:transcription antitermination factor NusG